MNTDREASMATGAAEKEELMVPVVEGFGGQR